MFKKLFKIIFTNLSILTASYSNNIFPETLSSIEEERLINEMLNGNTNSRNKLIEHNLRLVAHIVKKYTSPDYDTDDLISIGTIGLIKGIDSYSNKKGVKLTTYCARCIDNEILMYFRANNKNLKNISLEIEGNKIELKEKYKFIK